jgi:stearoyl-CoA desaturase (delta-9 desaturase)
MTVQQTDTRASAPPAAPAVRNAGTALPSARPAPKPPLQYVPGSVTVARIEQVALAMFIAVPFAAVAAAIPVMWGWGVGWHDLVISIVMFYFTGHGITVGFHRHFTHGAFKASTPVRVVMAVAGNMAIEGPVIRWVADHRRHHAYSDKDGDPHSPWRYGETLGALTKGLWHAHIGWLFDIEQTNQERFAPDLLNDPAINRVSRSFKWCVAASLLIPPLWGGLWSMSWAGAATAFFWGSLVRVAMLHHTTWAINSICHTWGEKKFKSRDRSVNVWWLAILSMGESWHNYHHADPSSARHGVRAYEIDTTWYIIAAMRKLGWAKDVRVPSSERVRSRLLAADGYADSRGTA